MYRSQAQRIAGDDAQDGVENLAVVEAEAEAFPHPATNRVDAHVDTQTDGHGSPRALTSCDLLQKIELVEVVDLDQRPFGDSPRQPGPRLVRTVADDARTGNAQAPCHRVFEVRDHLGVPALVVE